MPAKAFIDTNIVIYALGPASNKAAVAAPLFVDRPTISTQVLTEVTSVTCKRLAMVVDRDSPVADHTGSPLSGRGR